jgi:integrase
VPFIRNLRPDKGGKELTFFDGRVPGFGVRVKPTGSKTYFLKYRDDNHQQRKCVIGQVRTPDRLDGIEPGEALKRARRMHAAVMDGANPAASRDERRDGKTVGELCDEYLARGGFDPLDPVKASTLAMDRGRIACHIKPLLGARTIRSLAKADVQEFVTDIIKGKTAPKLKPDQKRPRGGVRRGGPGAAARSLDLLCAMLEHEVDGGTIPTNVARKIRRQKSQRIKPPFSFSAVEAVGKAMRELEAEGESVVGIRAIRHLLLSGFRRMEGLTLKWPMVDAAAHCARLADTKTGPQIRPLGQAALNHLIGFKPDGAHPKGYIFPGEGKAGHYVGAPKAWARIATRAGISGVSIHGLRHWFASAGAELNFSDLVIGGIIGHRARGVTGRYATTPDSALVAAANVISASLAKALGMPTAKAIPYRPNPN